jgi:NAD(P)-dependent dehydrogenase (short-subunit alcohol dehydrogenase family)
LARNGLVVESLVELCPPADDDPRQMRSAALVTTATAALGGRSVNPMPHVTPQRPLPSGFGPGTTAAEVLAGIDLTGQTAIVTGGSSGIGLETVRALAGAGARVVVPARRPTAAEAALRDASIPAEADALDLGDLGSVRGFARRFLASGRPLDILINNAGIMANPETRVGPGWESQFATNHLGHYALTNLLWPALAQAPSGARVVALSSSGHKRAALKGRLRDDDCPMGVVFEDIMFEARPYDKWQAYGQSKSANAHFAVQLDLLGRDDGVRAFAVHPGGIMTPLQRHISREEKIAFGWLDGDGNQRPDLGFKTPEAGASGAVWAATSPQLDGMGGVYIEDTDIAPRTEDLPEDQRRVRGVDPHAIDRQDAAQLWAVSAGLTGIDAFAAGA